MTNGTDVDSKHVKRVTQHVIEVSPKVTPVENLNLLKIIKKKIEKI